MAIATWKTGWRLWGTSLWNFCGAQQARLDAYVTVIRWSLHWCKLALFTAFMKWYRFPRFSVTLYRKKKEQASSLFTASTICKKKKKSPFLWKYFANWKALNTHRYHSRLQRLFYLTVKKNKGIMSSEISQLTCCVCFLITLEGVDWF